MKYITILLALVLSGCGSMTGLSSGSELPPPNGGCPNGYYLLVDYFGNKSCVREGGTL